jgi:hypothetical protein
MINAGTLLVDDMSNIKYVHFQKTMNAAETMKAEEVILMMVGFE